MNTANYFPPEPVASTPASPEVQDIQSQLGAGKPIQTDLRSRMESAFQTDFSNVRLHTDDNAASLSRSVQGRAFTVGDHIAFGSGEFQPGSLTTDAILAHELAHVMQQRVGQASPQGSAGLASGGEQTLEADADRSAAGALMRLWGGARQFVGRSQQAVPQFAREAMPRLRSGLSLQRCGFMVPDVWFPIYSARLNLGGDWFDVNIEMNSKAKDTGPANKKTREVYMYIDYAGDQDADISSINFQAHSSVIDMDPNVAVTSGQRKVTQSDDSVTQDWVKVDFFSDGKYVIDMTHTNYSVRSLVPPIRSHDFCVSIAGDKESCTTIQVKDWSAKLPEPAKPEPTGPAVPTPGLTPGLLEKLPTSTLLETISIRLNDIKAAAPGIDTLLTEVNNDRTSAANKNEAALRNAAEKLNQALVGVQSVFPALESLSKPENYLDNIAQTIIDRDHEIRDLYIRALEATYHSESEYGRRMADADAAMQAFPDFIVKQYLSKEGIPALVHELDKLRENLLQLRAKTGRANNSRPADGMIRFYNWGKDTPSAEINKDVASARRKRFNKDPQAAEIVQTLTQNAQEQIALTTTLVLYETFIYWVQQLDELGHRLAAQPQTWSGERLPR